MTENNRKQNNIYSITLFNKVIYFYISPGGASRSLFIEMIPVDSEYRAYGGFILLWFGSNKYYLYEHTKTNLKWHTYTELVQCPKELHLICSQILRES